MDGGVWAAQRCIRSTITTVFEQLAWILRCIELVLHILGAIKLLSLLSSLA